jgi:hypothetical protein
MDDVTHPSWFGLLTGLKSERESKITDDATGATIDKDEEMTTG